MIDRAPWLQVREALSGARVAIISNREGKEQQKQLESLMGMRLRWYVVNRNPRKFAAVETALAKGYFDVVIAFTGWVQHSVDRVCFKAARRGNSIYIRGHKGTPAQLLLALRRDLGL